MHSLYIIAFSEYVMREATSNTVLAFSISDSVSSFAAGVQPERHKIMPAKTNKTAALILMALSP